VRGVYEVRKAIIDAEKIRRLRVDGVVPSTIAKTLKIGRATIYRALAE